MKGSKRFRTLPGELKRRILVRYALFQLPDLLILVLILMVLHRWTDLSLWVYGSVAGLWVVKEIFVFPFRWKFYEPPRAEETRPLIGREGVAEERLTPSGYIRVEGELWQAEAVGTEARIEKGEVVFVEGIRGFTLLVQPISRNPPAPPKKPPNPPKPPIEPPPPKPPPKPPKQPKRTMGEDRRGAGRRE